MRKKVTENKREPWVIHISRSSGNPENLFSVTHTHTHGYTHTHAHKQRAQGSPGAHLECQHVWCALNSSDSVPVLKFSLKEEGCVFSTPVSTWSFTLKWNKINPRLHSDKSPQACLLCTVYSTVSVLPSFHVEFSDLSVEYYCEDVAHAKRIGQVGLSGTIYFTNFDQLKAYSKL